MKPQHELLIVDDELANLQKLKRTFVNEFGIHEAKSGEEALVLLKDYSISAIIADQRIQGMTGVDLLRQSLQIQPDAIRIILTGYTDVGDLMDAINKGHVHRYVTKPWEPFALRHTVKQELERWRLKRENELLEEQLRIAKEVQSYLFPQTFPKMETLDYTGVCRAARGVGGDYYDFLKLTPTQLCIGLADISGKGISAALLMASLQAMLRSHLPLHADPLDTLVSTINRLMWSTTESNKFASLFCGLYDDVERKLNYVNAGHNPPIILRAQSQGSPENPLLNPLNSSSIETANGRYDIFRLDPGGTVVGLFADAVFEPESVQMKRGDVLVAFTDDIVEALDGNQQEFGEKRLIRLVADYLSSSATDLKDLIMSRIDEFIGEEFQQDDLTLIIAKVV